jgi:hypothetical protein
MTGVLADPVEETRRILDAAQGAGIPVRAIGGIGVALRSPSIRMLKPARAYHDVDLVGAAPRAPIEALIADLGYLPSRRFNTLNGAERLLFHDATGRRIDVFLDTLRMCHELPFRDRLEVDALTLPLADLLLSKLQIAALTDRDAQDAAALLADHELTEDDAGIGLARIRAVCATDWGWWRTVDGNLRRLIDRWPVDAAAASPGTRVIIGTALVRADSLRERLDAARKSIAWQLRAIVGERMRWYDEPEEVR